jgi:hypothetical protein
MEEINLVFVQLWLPKLVLPISRERARHNNAFTMMKIIEL